MTICLSHTHKKTSGDHIYKRGLIYLVVLCYPVLSNLVEHAGSSILILLAIFGVPVCASKNRRPDLTWQEKAFLGMFVAYFLVYLFSFMVNGLTGNLAQWHGKHLEKEFFLLFFIPVYCLLKQIRPPQWVIWCGVSAGAIGVGLYSLIDSGWFKMGYRVRGAYNPILFGDISLLMAFMNLHGFCYLQKKRGLLGMLSIIGFIMGTIASFLTGSRGAWIAIPVFLAILFLHLRHYVKPRFIGMLIGVIFFAFLAVYRVPSTGVAARIRAALEDFKIYTQGTATVDGGVGNRLESWKAAWYIFKQHPVIGIGPGGYRYAVQKMISEGKLKQDPAVYFTQPHSIYLSVMVDCGLLGLVNLLAVFFLGFALVLPHIIQEGTSQEAAYAALTLVSGFMVFGLTETIFGRSVFVSFFIIMLSALLAQLKKPRD